MSDTISRHAAIDALCDNCDNVQAVCAHYPCKQYSAIDALPSAQPERKTGKWTEKKVMYLDDLEAKDIITEWQSAKCDVCGKYHTTPYMYYFSDYEYCPNCGAEMHGGKRDEQSKQ